MRDIQMNNAQAGMLASLFFLGFAVSQFGGGFLIRKTGTRWIAAAGLAGFSVFTALMGTAQRYWSMGAYRVGVGLAEGPVTVSMLTTLNNWFPPHEKARAINFYAIPATLGLALVVPVSGWIASSFDWRWIFYLFSLPGIITTLLWWWLVRTRPEEPESQTHPAKPGVSPAVSAPRHGMVPSWLKRFDPWLRVRLDLPQIQKGSELYRSPDVLGLWVAWICLNSIFYGLAVWIPTYLLRQRSLSILQMGWMTGLLWAGGVLGMLIGSWMADVVFHRRRKPSLLISNLATASMFGVLIWTSGPTWLYALYLFLAGLFLNMSVTGYPAYLMGLTSKELFPVAMGSMGTLGNIAAFLAPPLIGALIDVTGAYDAGFVFLIACALLAFLMVLTIRESVR